MGTPAFVGQREEEGSGGPGKCEEAYVRFFTLLQASPRKPGSEVIEMTECSPKRPLWANWYK